MKRLIFILAPLISSCSDMPTRAVPGPAASRKASLPPADIPPTIDEWFARISDLAPGFAGMYKEDGSVVIRTTGASSEMEIRNAVRSIDAEARFRGFAHADAGNRIRFAHADYDHGSLLEWRRLALSAQSGMTGIVSVDLDEVRNRVVIGVGDQTAASRVRARLETLPIPEGAVVVESGYAAVPQITLSHRLRPVPGGARIEHARAGCTLGVNAISEWGMGFVTASHCSNSWGEGGDYTTFFQPTARDSAANFVGWEIADPAFYIQPGQGICRDTIAVGCRYSDAAYALYQFDSTGLHGRIARTTGFGSTTINSLDPLFYVDVGVGILLVGDTLHQLGITSGWTWGPVTRTCLVIGYPELVAQGKTLICLGETGNGETEGGDSGGPYFTWDGSDWVVLWGILSGRLWVPGVGWQSLFSHWIYVDLELGMELDQLQVTYSP